MFQKVPGSELSRRMNILRARMDSDHPEWRLLAVFSKVTRVLSDRDNAGWRGAYPP